MIIIKPNWQIKITNISKPSFYTKCSMHGKCFNVRLLVCHEGYSLAFPKADPAPAHRARAPLFLYF